MLLAAPAVAVLAILTSRVSSGEKGKEVKGEEEGEVLSDGGRGGGVKVEVHEGVLLISTFDSTHRNMEKRVLRGRETRPVTRGCKIRRIQTLRT